MKKFLIAAVLLFLGLTICGADTSENGMLTVGVKSTTKIRLGKGRWYDVDSGKKLQWKSIKPGKYKLEARADGKRWFSVVTILPGKKVSVTAFMPFAGAASAIDIGHGRLIIMKWIPPGNFMLGSTPEERSWAAGPGGCTAPAAMQNEGEKPQPCQIEKGFWLGATEVTRAQWKTFIKDTGYKTDGEKLGQAVCINDKGKWDAVKGKSWHDPNWGTDIILTDKHPVVCVSWNDAMAFCSRITKMERNAGHLPDGYEYRLPTEAEWEYACRGGRKIDMFWWGDSILDGKGRLNGTGSESFKLPNGKTVSAPKHYYWNDGFGWPAPVAAYGLKGRNNFGLWDMSGNVWEWCCDRYDPKGAHCKIYRGKGEKYAMRGASFGNYPGELRCAFRHGDWPNVPNASVGMRICLAPEI
jgi:formylglycine-generating enzyme required for sulfatase activity